MSRALAKEDRIPLDAYYTEELLAEKLIAEIKPRGSILEPHVGGGAFAKALLLDHIRDNISSLTINDIDEKAPGLKIEDPKITSYCSNFLDWEEDTQFNWVIGNPPYSEFQSHVEKALAMADNVAFLLRLAVLESKKRIPFWKSYHPRHIWVLSERPSFTGGGTDSAAYGFFWWDRKRITSEIGDLTPTTLSILSWKK